jgi:hypothetical protein
VVRTFLTENPIFDHGDPCSPQKMATSEKIKTIFFSSRRGGWLTYLNYIPGGGGSYDYFVVSYSILAYFVAL